MKIEAFEAELKTIHPDFSIKVAPNNPDMAGIYWRDMYVCGVPSGDIFDERKEGYMNSMNMVHRTRPTARAQAINFLNRCQHEAGFLEEQMDRT